MLSRIQYWLSTGLSGVLLILVLANAWFFQGNVDRQVEVNQRQAVIQQAVQLEALTREILNALASLTIGKGDKPGDKQVEQMLGNLGIKVNPEPASATPTPPSSKQK